ncbi:TonB-dependent receptor [Sphingomonas carotinifaciens]|uniref:TonB-dependent receptor n=1 Tax=Sphingomonas carotinifaciens TaxID=1166323 RepID=A0A6N8LVJ1_9SPHN|nr:TonB-dependent receptor [Sphingomonas carotinifaciens]MWC45020.1 TonB-dependent receptor [Sphingomonas carotinifaciens]
MLSRVGASAVGLQRVEYADPERDAGDRAGRSGRQSRGATDLKPEKSQNVSIGAVFEARGFTATLDVYRIKVRDRIAISSTFQNTRLTNFLAANGSPALPRCPF